MFKLIHCRSTLSVDMPVNTRPICCDQQSLVYRSTVGDLSADYQWYQSIVNRHFAEIAAVTLPTEVTQKKIPSCMLLS